MQKLQRGDRVELAQMPERAGTVISVGAPYASVIVRWDGQRVGNVYRPDDLQRVHQVEGAR